MHTETDLDLTTAEISETGLPLDPTAIATGLVSWRRDSDYRGAYLESEVSDLRIQAWLSLDAPVAFVGWAEEISVDLAAIGHDGLEERAEQALADQDEKS